MPMTDELCAKISQARYEDLGEPAIEAARRLILDGIAIAIAGATEEEAIHILAAHYKERGGAPEATAIGNGFKLDMVWAAALNGAAMHVLDFEPMWSPANHALSTGAPRVYLTARPARRSLYEGLGWKMVEEAVGDLAMTVFALEA